MTTLASAKPKLGLVQENGLIVEANDIEAQFTTNTTRNIVNLAFALSHRRNCSAVSAELHRCQAERQIA